MRIKRLTIGPYLLCVFDIISVPLSNYVTHELYMYLIYITKLSEHYSQRSV